MLGCRHALSTAISLSSRDLNLAGSSWPLPRGARAARLCDETTGERSVIGGESSQRAAVGRTELDDVLATEAVDEAASNGPMSTTLMATFSPVLVLVALYTTA